MHACTTCMRIYLQQQNEKKKKRNRIKGRGKRRKKEKQKNSLFDKNRAASDIKTN